jgi:hypothetical protein
MRQASGVGVIVIVVLGLERAETSGNADNAVNGFSGDCPTTL